MSCSGTFVPFTRACDRAMGSFVESEQLAGGLARVRMI
jgi:hypothetical protein